MKKITGFISLLFLAQGLFALDGTEIAQRAHDVAESKTTHSAVAMTLIDKNGKEDPRMIEEFGMKENDLSTTIMIFKSPATVKDTRFMQKENDGSSDDKWIFLPALKKVRRIASSDGDKSFMGTDFTYDDMETRDVERDSHELIKEESVGEDECYVVKATSIDPEDSQYSYRISWIRKDNFVPVKMEMYDKSGDLVKVMQVLDLQQISGYWTPLEAIMENVQTGHKTKISVKKIVFDEGVDKRVFSQNFLLNGRY